MKRIGMIVIAMVIVGGAVFWGMRAREDPQVPVQVSDLSVPSGQEITLLETIQSLPGPGGLTIRFRFLAPAIAKQGGTVSIEAAQADMAHLCAHYALPRVTDVGPAIQQVIISLSDRPVPFGEADAEATQLFEAFSLADGTCIWEAF